jgi:hypothetical protein
MVLCKTQTQGSGGLAIRNPNAFFPAKYPIVARYSCMCRVRKADCAGLVGFTGWQKLLFGKGLGLVMGLFLKRWAFSNYIDGAIP